MAVALFLAGFETEHAASSTSPSLAVDQMNATSVASLSTPAAMSAQLRSLEGDWEGDGAEGTLMSDRFEFESPLGILGKIADWLFLASYLRRFMVRRNVVLKQLAESAEWSRYLEPT